MAWSIMARLLGVSGYANGCAWLPNAPTAALPGSSIIIVSGEAPMVASNLPSNGSIEPLSNARLFARSPLLPLSILRLFVFDVI